MTTTSMAWRERFGDMRDASRSIDYMFEKMRESVGQATHMHSQGYACCVQSRHAKSMRYPGGPESSASCPRHSYPGDTERRVRRARSRDTRLRVARQRRPQIFPQHRTSLVRSVGLLEDERRRLRVDTVDHRSAVVQRREHRLHVLWEPEGRLCQRVEVRELGGRQHQLK